MARPGSAEVVNTTINRFDMDSIPDWANAFYQARKVEGVSEHTLTFYQQQLSYFLRFCEAQVIGGIAQLTPDIIRRFILAHGEAGHNTGGQHAAYRALKAFLRWYEAEAEPPGWKNPINKVKAPKVAQELLEPAGLADVEAMIGICGDDLHGQRDKALFLALLDTGARAAEMLALDVGDIDLITGEVTIKHGKGGKGRTVFLGKAARKALRRYLQGRPDGGSGPVLWLTDAGERLTYHGLRGMVARRAKAAGIKPPMLHAFRRAFALNCLRAGMDVYSLQRLMGHADLSVLRRYLAQTTDDLRAAHGKCSPSDQLRWR